MYSNINNNDTSLLARASSGGNANGARSSLRGIKNWQPFCEQDVNTAKMSKDDTSQSNHQSSGFVKRMINSFSSKSDNQKNSLKKQPTTATISSINRIQLEETQNGIQIQIKQPHLIWVRSDSSPRTENTKTSIKIYPLKLGRTYVGTDAKKNDIVLLNEDDETLASEHCFIDNVLVGANDARIEDLSVSSNTSSSSGCFSTSGACSSATAATTNQKLVNMVTLYPVTGNMCAVDGVIVEHPYILNSGKSEYFRFNYPDEEQTNPSTRSEGGNMSSVAGYCSVSSSKNIPATTNTTSQQEPQTTSSRFLLGRLFDKTDSKSHDKHSENGNNKTRVRFNLPSAGPKQSSTDPNKLKYLSVDNNSSSSIGLSTSHNVDSDNKLVITENSDNSSSSSMSSLRKNSEISKLKSKFETNNSTSSNSSSGSCTNKVESSKSSAAFLSKLNKFELLSRGIRPPPSPNENNNDDDDLITNNNNSDQSSTCSICSSIDNSENLTDEDTSLIMKQSPDAALSENLTKRCVKKCPHHRLKKKCANKAMSSLARKYDDDINFIDDEEVTLTNTTHDNVNLANTSVTNVTESMSNQPPPADVFDKHKSYQHCSHHHHKSKLVADGSLSSSPGPENHVGDSSCCDEDDDDDDNVIYEGCNSSSDENDSYYYCCNNCDDKKDAKMERNQVNDYNDDYMIDQDFAKLADENNMFADDIESIGSSDDSSSNSQPSSNENKMVHSMSSPVANDRYDQELAFIANNSSSSIVNEHLREKSVTKRKSRSAPITPTRFNRVNQEPIESEKANANNNNSSFVYDMNLYDARANIMLLNLEDEATNRSKTKRAGHRNSFSGVDSITSSSSSSLSSSTSSSTNTFDKLNADEYKDNGYGKKASSSSGSKKKKQLEPLIINEDERNVETSNMSTGHDANSFQQSKVEKLDVSVEDATTAMISNQEDKKLAETSADDCKKMSVETREDSVSSSTTVSPTGGDEVGNEEGQEENEYYQRVKQEREDEEKQAELEKARLQEILDICMEFQSKQDEKKSVPVNNKQPTVSSNTQQIILSPSSDLTQLPTLKTAILMTSSHSVNSIKSSNHHHIGNMASSGRTNHVTTSSVDENPDTRASNKTSPNQEISTKCKKTSSVLIDQQRLQYQELEKLSREKCHLASSLARLRQQITQIEMRQNEAIRDLEMERALLEVEHNNELKSIQNDEAKLKQLQHEHQAKLDGFARHTNQIRDEIEMIQMTIKNIENEILILDTSLDASAHYDTLRAQKEHSLDEAKHIHEDLEFQLMELEAKYETELEDIQNRLISEQDNLLRIFRQRQTSLSEYDQQQTQMLLRVKAETEQLEMERLKLIDEFKRQKDLLQNVEKKMNRLVIQMQKQSSDELINIQDLSLTGSSSSSTSSSNQQQQEQTPSPASSSVSLSSTSNNSNSEASTSSSSAVNSLSTNTTTSTTSPSSSSTSSQTTSHKEQELPGKLSTKPPPASVYSPLFQQTTSNYQHLLTQTPNRYLGSSQSGNYVNLNHFYSSSMNQRPISTQQPTSNNLSQSFKDILQNTLLINSLYETATPSVPNYSQVRVNKKPSVVKFSSKVLMSSSNNQQVFVSDLEDNEENDTFIVGNCEDVDYDNRSNLMSLLASPLRSKSTKPSNTSTNRNQLAMRITELERTLAMNKVENYALLEQQLIEREQELQKLREEKRRRDEADNTETGAGVKSSNPSIKLRENKKNKTQARPLTRYLPVREENQAFDLRQHVENSGHQLLNQIDAHTKQPLIHIDAHTCRGYLLKMGQNGFRSWNKRWFVFDRLKRTLTYYMDKHESKLRGTIYFQSINEVYVDHMRTIKTPDVKSTFVVKTNERNFYLVAPSSELMRIWVDVIFTGAEGYLEFNDD